MNIKEFEQEKLSDCWILLKCSLEGLIFTGKKLISRINKKHLVLGEKNYMAVALKTSKTFTQKENNK